MITNQLLIDNNQDNQDFDAATRLIIKERDQERLRKMTFYCFTNECLRDYILKYFGEYGSNYCGNCSNCFTQFEKTDVTEIAKALVGCVESSRQRYGTTVIIDTVHGANTAKIKSYRMDGNPYYGTLRQMPVYRIRQVLNHLRLNGYLFVTEDDYGIVKLTEQSGHVMKEDSQIIMKLAKESSKQGKKGQDKGKTSKKDSFQEGTFTEKEESLFEKLRALRLEIAREEKVPPYIVFSDKTLTHMCLVKPKTKEEMMTVSGVGQFKFEKYGDRFLACISSFSLGNG